MRLLQTAAGTLLVIAATLPTFSDEGDADAEKLFRHSCIGCHTVPDPDFATDQAWLRQIERTA